MPKGAVLFKAACMLERSWRCSGARRPRYVNHFVNLPSTSFYKDGALLFISFNASHRWATQERKSPLATRYLPPRFCSQHFRQMSVISHPTWRMMAGNANENKQRIWPGDKVYRGATAFLNSCSWMWSGCDFLFQLFLVFRCCIPVVDKNFLSRSI